MDTATPYVESPYCSCSRDFIYVTGYNDVIILCASIDDTMTLHISLILLSLPRIKDSLLWIEYDSFNSVVPRPQAMPDSIEI